MAKRHFSVSPKVRSVEVMNGFAKLWESLFESPVHLDSALSKQAPKVKTILAQIVPQILLRPSSMAEALGIGVPPGEPWNLSAQQLATWKPARMMVERAYAQMSEGLQTSDPTREDFPPWMIAEWLKFGEEVTDQLVSSLGVSAPLGLRVSREKNRTEFLAELTEGSRLPVRAELSGLSATGIRLSGYAPILQSDAYKEGQFEIQDEGSQVLAHFALWPEIFLPLLTSVPGSSKNLRLLLPDLKTLKPRTIIDTCAGAGGKTLAMSDAVGGKGRVFAYDVSQTKLQALRRRATRAGLNNVQTLLLEEGNESVQLKSFAKTADTVLVDAPCSGWGVLRRNPDIKWRQSPEILSRFPELQSRLLSVYSDLVAPGGFLVFSLCSFREEETVQTVQAFLSQHADFESIGGGYLGPSPSDGFFMHAFKRKGKGP